MNKMTQILMLVFIIASLQTVSASEVDYFSNLITSNAILVGDSTFGPSIQANDFDKINCKLAIKNKSEGLDFIEKTAYLKKSDIVAVDKNGNDYNLYFQVPIGNVSDKVKVDVFARIEVTPNLVPNNVNQSTLDQRITLLAISGSLQIPNGNSGYLIDEFQQTTNASQGLKRITRNLPEKKVSVTLECVDI